MNRAPCRLNRAPRMGQNAPAIKLLERHCMECGDAFHTPARTPGLFCSTTHKADWQNRRQRRGAVLYDLYMANRYNRPLAAVLKAELGLSVMTLMSRLASHWHEEDLAERDGRRTWRTTRTVLSDNPHLFAVPTTIRKRARS